MKKIALPLIAGLALFAGLTWYLYRRTMREAV